MITDLIFDFDGTLSDTYPVVTNVLLDILAAYGIKEDYERAYANLKISYRYACKQYDIELKPNELLDLLIARAAEAAFTEQHPFSDALDLLKSASEGGIRNFIYTHSGEFVHRLIEKWGFSPYITYTLDSSMGFPLKPDPTALNYLCDTFGIDKNTALMVGDRDIDIEVGHNAGIKGCLFDTGGFYRGFPAEYRIESLSDIKKLF